MWRILTEFNRICKIWWRKEFEEKWSLRSNGIGLGTYSQSRLGDIEEWCQELGRLGVKPVIKVRCCSTEYTENLWAKKLERGLKENNGNWTKSLGQWLSSHQGGT